MSRSKLYARGESFSHDAVHKYIASSKSDFLRSDPLTLRLLVSSTDNLCKPFGRKSGPTNRLACSGSILFDTLMVFLIFFSKS